MNYFKYNGVNSYDMGLRIESKNVFSAPKYDTAFQSIPGRDGDLILPNGRYPNVQVTYSVFLPAKTLAELQEKITAVKAWLYTQPDGYHELRVSYDAATFRRAVINTQLDIEDQLNKIGVFTVSFSCLPYKYLDSGQTAVTITSGVGNSTLTNPTPFASKPLIRINGNGEGTLSVLNQNGVQKMTFSAIENYVTVDSELMLIHRGAVNKSDTVTADGFPILTGGMTMFMFSGGITSIAVTPRWVTL